MYLIKNNFRYKKAWSYAFNFFFLLKLIIWAIYKGCQAFKGSCILYAGFKFFVRQHLALKRNWTVFKTEVFNMLNHYHTKLYLGKYPTLRNSKLLISKKCIDIYTSKGSWHMGYYFILKLKCHRLNDYLFDFLNKIIFLF